MKLLEFGSVLKIRQHTAENIKNRHREWTNYPFF